MAVRSRLTRKEEARSLRRAFLFISLTVLTLVLLVFWGIPSLVRVATFFSQWQTANMPVGKQDTLPPSPPKLNLIPRATKKDFLSLSGTAEPGSTIEIFLNGMSLASVVTNNEGNFIVDRLKLSLGENQIYAVATDLAGNKSQPSKTKEILLDSQPPELEIFMPQDGAIFSGEAQKKINVSGKTEPGLSLTINDRLIILNQEGNFSIIFTLADGENTIKFVVSDLAENKTEKEIKVTFSP